MLESIALGASHLIPGGGGGGGGSGFLEKTKKLWILHKKQLWHVKKKQKNSIELYLFPL